MNSWWNDKASWFKKKLKAFMEKVSVWWGRAEQQETAENDSQTGRMSIKSLLVRVKPRQAAGAAIAFAAVALIVWTVSSGLPETSDASETVEMAVLPAEYSPTLEIEAEMTASHLSYQTMKEQLVGWVCEFGRINIRDEASFDGKVIDYVVYGDQLTVYEQVGEFSHVRYVSPISGEILEGYCYTEYISATEPEGAEVYLNVPLYKQADYRWGAVKIGGYETLASAGCTTSCIAMVETYMTGEEVYPDDVADMLYYTYDGKLTFPSRYDKYYRSDYLSVVVEKLHEGIPVLISGYTSAGKTHWVVIVGYSGDGEDFSTDLFMINDPGSYRTTLTDFMKSYPFIEKIVYYAE